MRTSSNRAAFIGYRSALRTLPRALYRLESLVGSPVRAGMRSNGAATVPGRVRTWTGRSVTRPKALRGSKLARPSSRAGFTIADIFVATLEIRMQ